MRPPLRLVLLAFLPLLAACSSDPATPIPADIKLLSVDRSPVGLALTGTGLLAVSAFDSKLVRLVDWQQGRVLSALTVRSGPSSLIADPLNDRLYCLHKKENAIAVLGGHPLQVEKLRATGSISLAGGRLRPGTRELWVCDGLNSVHVLLLPSLSIKRSLTLGRYPQQVAFSPDGERAFVTLTGENAVAVLDGANGRTLAQVPVGIYPRDIAWVHGWVVVSNSSSADLSVLDGRTFKELGRVPVRKQPNSLAGQDDRVWVACEGSYRVLQVDLATRKVVGSLRLGFYPGTLLLLPDQGLVVASSSGNQIALVHPKTLLKVLAR